MSKKKIATRSKTVCPVFGYERELPDNVLPSSIDVMRYYLLVQNTMEFDRGGQHPAISEISEVVAQKLELLWKKAYIPIISHTRVIQKIRQYRETYNGITKHHKSRQNRHSFKISLISSRKILRICSIWQRVRANSASVHVINCFVFLHENNCFLKSRNQRNLRLMCIGSVDMLTTNNLKRKLERKCKLNSQKSSETATSQISTRAIETCTIATSSDEEYIPEKVSCTKGSTSSIPECSTSQNRLRLPSLANMTDRFGVSDRAAAARAAVAKCLYAWIIL